MRTLLLDPPPQVQAWLAERRALGQDLYDEVWEGTYLVAPAPHPAHGYLDRQLAVLLAPYAAHAGLVGSGPLNVGEPDDYRVPDGAFTDGIATTTFVPTVVIAVEIVSPGDKTWDKLSFYFARGVQELLVADPREQQLHWFTRGPDALVPADGSTVLDVTSAALAGQLQWPPLT